MSYKDQVLNRGIKFRQRLTHAFLPGHRLHLFLGGLGMLGANVFEDLDALFALHLQLLQLLLAAVVDELERDEKLVTKVVTKVIKRKGFPIQTSQFSTLRNQNEKSSSFTKEFVELTLMSPSTTNLSLLFLASRFSSVSSTASSPPSLAMITPVRRFMRYFLERYL